MKSNIDARYEWRDRIKELAGAGDYAGVLKLMAMNYGDRGDVMSLIDDFCENADPWDGEE